MAGTIIVNSARTDASNVFTIKTATGDNMLQVGVGGLAASTITTAMLADNSVTAAKIAPGTIVDSDLGDNAVTTAKIADDAVTVAKLNLISTSSVPSIEARSDGTTDGYIQLNCTANTHGIKLKSPPHSAGASYTLTFPNDDGNSGQALTTNGSGVMTWATAGSTSASDLTSGTLPDARFPSTLPAISGANLTGIVAGGPSLGTASVIRTNAQTISENITIPSTTNGMSAGPITIADSYTITVNGNWSIV